MRLIRGVWVGASLLLALAGCTKDSDEIKGGGSYSPIITGISTAVEPAARGIPNQLTAHITNVNNLPLTYRWRVSVPGDTTGLLFAGTLSDSTVANPLWTPPDSIGTWDVTVVVEADDPATGTHYTKSSTVHISVDNHFTRWTRSEAIQFDPAPVPGGGLLYSQIRSTVTGESDVYRVETVLGASSKLTTDFFTATSPTPRADLAEFAFAGKRRSSDAGPSIWLLPWGGGDTTSARVVAQFSNLQSNLGNPRFAPQGTRLLYNSDTTSTPFVKMFWRDVLNFAAAPVPIIEPSTFPQFIYAYVGPNWGPDSTGDGFPEALIVNSYDNYGTPGQVSRGVFKFTTAGNSVEEFLWISDGLVEEPDWSSDGSLVVYARRNPGTHERDIWVVNANATNLANAVRVTSGPADESHPRFSQDGSTIFFVSNRADRYSVNGIFNTERRGTNLWSVAGFDRPAP